MIWFVLIFRTFTPSLWLHLLRATHAIHVAFPPCFVYLKIQLYLLVWYSRNLRGLSKGNIQHKPHNFLSSFNVKEDSIKFDDGKSSHFTALFVILIDENNQLHVKLLMKPDTHYYHQPRFSYPKHLAMRINGIFSINNKLI